MSVPLRKDTSRRRTNYSRLGPEQASRRPKTGALSQSFPNHTNRKSRTTSPMLAMRLPPFLYSPITRLDDLRNRWNDVQTAFVDEPRRAVEQADGLVASAMKRLAEVFAEERSKLEKQWDRGDNVSTEDLRVALQRYRAFFHRLLSI